MKQVITPIVIALLVAMSLVACSDSLPQREAGELVTVNLNMQASSLTGTGETRASTPLTAEYENLIRDIWVIQYHRDVIYGDVTAHYRAGEPGVMKLENFPVTLHTTNGEDCLVYFLVNLEDDIPNVTNAAQVPDNIYAFQRLKVKMDLLSTGTEVGDDLEAIGLFGKIYMFGYYKGPIDAASTSLNVLLGRLGARLNICITNETGEALSDMKVKLKNVPTQMYVSEENRLALSDAEYTNYAEEIGAIANDQKKNLYYYVAEDYHPVDENRTILEITGTRGGANKTIEITLGGDPNSTDANRDYSLIRNHNYTYNIRLKP